jgi:hypothetical protein
MICCFAARLDPSLFRSLRCRLLFTDRPLRHLALDTRSAGCSIVCLLGQHDRIHSWPLRHLALDTLSLGWMLNCLPVGTASYPLVQSDLLGYTNLSGNVRFLPRCLDLGCWSHHGAKHSYAPPPHQPERKSEYCEHAWGLGPSPFG